MKNAAMRAAVTVLRCIYFFIRPLSIKNKVTFISRQPGAPAEDINMLAEAIKKAHTETEVCILVKTLDSGILQKLSYSIHLLMQMYHISTSKMIILDGYCICASVLNHKAGNVIVQMWHASCALKQFGWQTVDRPAGSSRATASIMKMHRNYTYVMASSRKTAEIYCRAFRVPADRIIYSGMPHFAELVSSASDAKEKILECYPQMKAKEIVLYIPTFRKNRTIQTDKLAGVLDHNRCSLVVRPHALSSAAVNNDSVFTDNIFSTYDWIKAADAVITDYSSLAVEAAIAGKRLYFYTYDLQTYEAETGLNIRFDEEPIGKYAADSADKLASVMNEPYDYKALEQFRKEYVEVNPETPVDDFMNFFEEAVNINE